MNLSFVYQKLFDVSGYSFIVDKNGCLHEWSSEEMTNRGFHGPNMGGHRLHLVPGSFNPLHESHKEIYEHVFSKREVGSEHPDKGNVFFEMSIERVDKNMVSLSDLGKRLEQFQGYAPVIVSRAPRFVEKIGVYLTHVKGVTFHVGIDCISRMTDDYGLWGIQGLAAKFVVHDRIMNGKHMSLDSEFGQNIPRNCKPAGLIRTPESLKRSSTEIRNNKQ